MLLENMQTYRSNKETSSIDTASAVVSGTNVNHLTVVSITTVTGFTRACHAINSRFTAHCEHMAASIVYVACDRGHWKTDSILILISFHIFIMSLALNTKNKKGSHTLGMQKKVTFQWISLIILQFDWARAVVCQLNLKYLHVKITNLLRVVV